ncbi:putative monooxygenase MoxC [compost metagenome]
MTLTKGLHIGIGLDAGSRNIFHTETGPGGLLQRLDAAADLIIIEDRFARPDGDGLDAVLFANWLGAKSQNAGILAGAPVNVLEPFHISTAIATLDYVTEGRSGLLAQSLAGDHAASARRFTGPLNGYPADDRLALDTDFGEAIDVIRRLWDSWEDDAVIRDVESQRFVDGAKLRYVDFKGNNFSVLGPSITPRPPQGQPIIATTISKAGDLAAKANVDLVFLRADIDELSSVLKTVSAAQPDLRFFADIDLSSASAEERTDRQWQDEAERIAARVREWTASGIAGIRLLPRQPDRDLRPVVDHLLPALRTAGIGRPQEASTLRERLALPVATNRYVNAA